MRKINDILDIPEEVWGKTPKITMTGFEEVLIENFKGILEYEDFFTRINTHIGVVNINGFNLKLNQMTEEDILVTGKIESIDFEAKK
jgi:sporulation protein YqfC